jgi:hypothetical protein
MVPHWQLVAVVAMAMLAACSTTKDEQQQPDVRAGFRRSEKVEGVGFSVVEQAHDGTHTVDLARVSNDVDANSRLTVSFQVDATEDLAGAPAEWRALVASINAARRLSDWAAELDALVVDEHNPESVDRGLREVRNYYARQAQFFATVKAEVARLRPDVDVNQIVTGAAVGSDKPSDFYGNVTRWIRAELDRLRSEPDQRFAGRERVKVFVQAYHDPTDGERQMLHVTNYDKLPVGDLQPIDRMGLKLTRSERQRLDREIAASRTAARAIDEIQEDGAAFLRRAGDKVKQLAKSLGEIVKALNDGPGWMEQLRGAIARLEAFTSEDQKVQDAARELANSLNQIVASFPAAEKIKSARQLTEQIAGSVRADDLVGSLTRIGDLATLYNANLANLVTTWTEQAAKVRNAISQLRSNVEADQLATLLPKELRDLLLQLTVELPATMRFVDFAQQYLVSGRDRRDLGELLAGAREHAIPRTLDNLPDGTVDLRRAGLDLDDHVGLNVRFQQQGGELLEEMQVETRAVLTGFHRRIGGKLIFARADTGPGDAQDWKPNVAAVASWHYRFRNVDDDKAKWFWNATDLAWGVHVASLDQADDSAEVGLGINVSLFDDLVTGGFGWNLSSDDGAGEYFFVGIDLLDVLRSAGTLGQR